MKVIRMSDVDLAGKRVLIREDLNVPVAAGKVTRVVVDRTKFMSKCCVA